VYLGTTAGQIIVMDVHGAMVSQVQLSNDVGITMMAWSCEKFKMEEGDETEHVVGQYTPPAGILITGPFWLIPRTYSFHISISSLQQMSTESVPWL
jgi:branched-subunit amino acid permease